MKSIITSLLVAVSLTAAAQQDSTKVQSPPATLTAVSNGATININYSQPAVKGRSIGKEIAPYGKVWRTGANQATTFQVDKDVMVEGKPLKAGTYALFTIPGDKEWIIIFNKQANQWGAFRYKQEEDVLRVTVPAGKSSTFYERMTFQHKNEKVSLVWGGSQVDFTVR